MAKGLAAVTPAERKAIRDRWIRIEVGHVVSRRAMTAWLVGATLAFTLAAALALAWSRTMKARVAVATAGLQGELAERHRVEAALRRSERKLALHLEQTVVGVMELDAAFRIVYWNTAAERISAGPAQKCWVDRPTSCSPRTSGSSCRRCGEPSWPSPADCTTSTGT